MVFFKFEGFGVIKNKFSLLFNGAILAIKCSIDSAIASLIISLHSPHLSHDVIDYPSNALHKQLRTLPLSWQYILPNYFHFFFFRFNSFQLFSLIKMHPNSFLKRE